MASPVQRPRGPLGYSQFYSHLPWPSDVTDEQKALWLDRYKAGDTGLPPPPPKRPQAQPSTMTSDWNSGFRAGVEAMRERAAQCCDAHAASYTGNCNTTPKLAATNCATLIRTYLPAPGEEHGPISDQEANHA
ncbi:MULTISPECIES: hypothetical protein [Achromobacter]|uniref:hypothetical protein n=1 Tax=Achromobacter TaxID=222 RepID=UPI0009708600|nr:MULTISPECIES: hypothetical protein [Achromobacter]MCV6799867.1 hypothetical protein [Achromobacter ruhlandii]MCV6801423.1 hypothetical protein [Achromobacter ruhlandii]MCV6812342.1 hypothetical protein [Achromobacter ruhlandii]MCV6822455.1 hypothetical protein [Achromobacter ruhlandii]